MRERKGPQEQAPISDIYPLGGEGNMLNRDPCILDLGNIVVDTLSFQERGKLGQSLLTVVKTK